MQELLQDVVNAVSLGGLYALMALGVALIFGVMSLINFAHGEFIMAGTYVLIIMSGIFLPLAIFAAIALVVTLAIATERIAFRSVRGADPSTLLVTSFAVSFLLQNVGLLIFGGRARSANFLPSLNEPMVILGLEITRLDAATVVVALVLIGGLAWFLEKTSMGLEMRAASADFRMARLLGVEANKVIATAFAISGILAVAVAALLLIRTGTATPGMGLQPVLIAFVATVIGGLGRLWAAAAGGFLLGCLTVALQQGLPEDLVAYRDAFLFGFVILVLLVRPGGLLGKSALRERV